MKTYVHQPVMVKEVVEYLSPQKGEIFVDGTLGLGGHSKALLEKGAKVIGIDQDMEAIKRAQENLKDYPNIIFINDNFSNVEQVLKQLKIEKVDGILLDLGVSSMQLDNSSRGFSFRQDAPLDMRMDQSQKFSAFDVINHYSEEDLAKVLQEYGEEREAKNVARAIVQEREKKPIQTTLKLVETIKSVMPKWRLHQKTHFATRVFQGVRIEVNDELKRLINFLSTAAKIIKPKGRLAIISFHSLEDRVVKRAYKMIKLEGKGTILTPKPVTPSLEEKRLNVRSRSAKLRVLEIS